MNEDILSQPSESEIYNVIHNLMEQLGPEFEGLLLHYDDGTPIVLENAKHLLALTSGIDEELHKKIFLVIAHLKRYQIENEGVQQIFTVDGVIELLEKLIAQSVEEKAK